MIFVLLTSADERELSVDAPSYLYSRKQLGKDFLTRRLPDRLHDLWNLLLDQRLKFRLGESVDNQTPIRDQGMKRYHIILIKFLALFLLITFQP